MTHSHVRFDWLLSVAAFYVYSAAIQSLPEPKPAERWYGFFYKFVHLLGANFRQFGIKNGDSAPKG